MLTVVTGAAGFVGRTLAARMAETGYPGTVRLVDHVASPVPSDAYEAVVADLTDRSAMASALGDADTIIHLAALPGGASEADPAASRRINLDASLNLIDLLAIRARPARFVYASSIAVLGADLPETVDDRTPPRPAMIYGAHKLMVEVALADAVRRGAIDGIALRLPGVVARPSGPGGLKSAFMSEIFHAVRADRPYVLPVGPDATMWIVSAQAGADALIHGARLPRSPLIPGVLTLPAPRVRMADLVAAIADAIGCAATNIGYRPDPLLEAQFGRLPQLSTPAADAIGFVHDGDLHNLVATVLAGLEASSQ